MIIPHFLNNGSKELVNSKLYDENSFYECFIRDLKHARKRVIIESPYITQKRLSQLIPVFYEMEKKNIKIYVITRPPCEHDKVLLEQSSYGIKYMKCFGVSVKTIRGKYHQKIAIIDQDILWEGSLNILSQTYSHEIMRRIEGKSLVKQMFDFLGLDNLI